MPSETWPPDNIKQRMDLAQPTEAVVVQFDCAVCGKKASRIELTPPGAIPPTWASFDAKNRAILERRRESSPEKWWLVYSGPDSGSGGGHQIDEDEAERILALMTTTPLTGEIVTQAGFHDNAGFCTQCGAVGPQSSTAPRPYCYDHWNVSSTGYGTCPSGHGKSLDPHWSPE